MTRKKSIAVIAIRLLALYMIWEGLKTLPAQIISLSSLPPTETIGRAAVLSLFIYTATTLLAGLFLWVFSIPIASAVCKGAEVDPHPGDGAISMEAMQTVAVSVLGLFVLSNAIPSMVNLIVTYVFPTTNPRYVYTLEGGGKLSAQIPVADYVSVTIQAALGFWFLLGSRGIVNFVTTIWNKGKTM